MNDCGLVRRMFRRVLIDTRTCWLDLYRNNVFLRFCVTRVCTLRLPCGEGVMVDLLCVR